VPGSDVFFRTPDRHVQKLQLGLAKIRLLKNESGNVLTPSPLS